MELQIIAKSQFSGLSSIVIYSKHSRLLSPALLQLCTLSDP